MSDQKRWTTLGERNPYWAVLAEPRYRSDRITADDLRDFYATGESEIEETLARIRAHVLADFRPELAIDYGCGVGRLTLPLARRSARVIGVDVSHAMLREARKAAQEQQVTNADFLRADEFLDGAGGADRPDFVHSYIVLQHVHPRTGMRISATLLSSLRAGGVAALHYTFGRRMSALRRISQRARQLLPPLRMAANLIQGKPLLEPGLPMHEYRLTRLFEMFERHGAAAIHVFPTDHGGHLGAMFIFRRR